MYTVYPSFRTYGAYPFPFFSQENGIHHSFSRSVTSGSGDRPRKEVCHGGGVYSFFPASGETKLSTSTVAALFSKMALTGQRIAMVDMLFQVFTAFPYLP